MRANRYWTIVSVTILIFCGPVMNSIDSPHWADSGNRSLSFSPDVRGGAESQPRLAAYNDSDGNRIDDYIDSKTSEDPDITFDVFVNYHAGIRKRQILDLEGLGLRPSFISKYINTLILEKVSRDAMEEILELEDVAGIEYAPPLLPGLDISTRAVKARPSQEYRPTVWGDLELTGHGVNVAIIDTGVDDVVHSGLRGKFVRGVDTSSPLGYMEMNPDDGVGHGTHCAGIIMGTGEGGDQIGIAPNASLIDCKVGDTVTLGSATPTNFMEGLEWVRDNAERHNITVLSISMGTEHSTNGDDAVSRMANEVVDAGVTVVVAIGNDDGSHNANVVSSPGSADKVITVGALNDRNTVSRSDDHIAAYSQSGPRPGDGDSDREDELKPDIVAPGTDISSCMHNTRTGYIHFSGTSMATPHVAGLAALMKQAFPSLRPPEIKEILHHSAEAKGNPYDSGVDDKYNTLYGWGMIDAYGAVRRASDIRSSRLAMPGYVGSGSRLTVKAMMDLSRNVNMVKPDSVTWKISYPVYFSSPENITMSVHQDAEAELEWESPYIENEMWMIEARTDVTGIHGEMLEVSPELEFQSWAPHVGEEQRFSFRINATLNGVECPERAVSLTVGGAAEHMADLTVNPNDIAFSSNPADAGEEVTISVNVSNVGLSDTFGVNVDFFDGNPTSGIPIGSDEIDVAGRETAQASTVWMATPGTLHNIFVVVDPGDEIDELSETNNTASKPLVVRGGVNLEPTAALEADPKTADIGEWVSFSGAGSTDPPPGQVTEWRFSFGDGNDSGWLPVDYADHSYEIPGIYIAFLTVRDNGGKESTNDATVEITVKELVGGNMGFYLTGTGNLSTSGPKGSIPDSAPVPNGYTPYPFPGSPVGRVEYKEIGEWRFSCPRETRNLVERGTMTFWIRNVNEDRGFDAQFRARVAVNGENILEGETAEVPVEAGSQPLRFDIYEDGLDTMLKYLSDVEILLEGKVNGNDLELVYGSERFPGGFTTKYLPEENEPPNILEAPDVVGRVGEEVTVEITAEDGDGTILSYRWDFDNDHEWDMETAEGNVTHVFDIPDEHRVNFMVVDDDGAGSEAYLVAEIYTKGVSEPPVVLIEHPANGSTLRELITFRGSASDDIGIDRVQVSLDQGGWTTVSGSESWEYDIDPGQLEPGMHMFSVKATDIDEIESAIASIVFFVEDPGSPPVIASTSVEPGVVNNSGAEIVTISVRATDENGPEDIRSVMAELGEIGRGQMNCERVGEDEYGLDVKVPRGTPPGEKILGIIVSDSGGRTALGNVSLTVVEMDHAPELEVESGTIRVDMRIDRSFVVTVIVSDGNGPEDIVEVTADLTAMAGGEEVELNDRGHDGDEEAEDGIYTLKYDLSPDTAPGRRSINIRARDRSGLVVGLEMSVVIIGSSDGVPEEEEGTSRSLMVYGGIGIVVLFLLCGVGYIFRRKYKSH